MTDHPTPLRCPYVGLQPYTEADIDYFFGRERDQRIIAANLGAARLTILYGASGVGKSSVLLAGVVPSLRARPRTAVVVVRDWRGPNFIDALKSECREAVERVLQDPLSIGSRLPLDEFLEAAGQALRGSVLIIFDQFEEYFLYHPESETGQTFDAELARAVNRDDVDASFLIVMREDGLARLDRFGGRIPNLLGNTLRLQHLTTADAAAAIRKPLDVFNDRHADASPVTIEDALVSAVIDQVRSGQVMLSRSGGVGQADGTEKTAQIEAPFLQLVMTRLWEEEANAGSHTLRLATLDRLGGAEQIVRMHLDGVMDSLDGASQEVCAKFFDRLVTPSGAKIACTIRDLTDWAGPNSGEVAPILETLCAKRILRAVATPGAKRQSETSYEIFNDVLAPAILDWRRSYLQAQERAQAERRSAEQAQAEAKARYANRIRNLWAALSVAGVCAIFFLGLWVWELQLQSATLARQAYARKLAAEAQDVLERDPELGTLLAIEAVRATSSAGEPVIDTAADVMQHILLAPRAEKRLFGLSGVPRTLFFSHDGTHLVATSSQPRTVIWDAMSGSRVPTMLDEKPVRVLAFSADGHRFAAAGSDGTVTVLDAASGKATFTVVHNKLVAAAAFSPDGQRLATASADGTAIISDAGSGSEPVSLVGQGNNIVRLTYSPDAKWLAVASQDKTVTVRDAENGTEAFKSAPGQSGVDTLSFNAKGDRLAALSHENMTMWEVPSGKSSSFFGQYNAVAISPNGNALAASRDGSVHLWDVSNVESVKSFRTLFHTDPILDLVFSPDSSRIAMVSADGTAKIWDIGSGAELLSLRVAKASKVAFSPDSTQFAAASVDGAVNVWNISSHAAEVFRIAFSAKRHLLATSGADADGTVKIWDADNRRPLGALGSHLRNIYGLAFSPDGNRLVTASQDGQLTLWDLSDLKRPQAKDPVATDLKWVDLAVSKDGKTLVAAGTEGAAKMWDLEVWDTAKLRESRPFGGPESAQAIAWSGDGRHLATVRQDGHELEIWDEEANAASWHTDSDKDMLFHDIVLSPSGRYVASVSTKGLVQVWDTISNEPLPPLPANYLAHDNVSEKTRNAMAFSSDHLAIAYAKTVVVWDIANKGNPTFIRIGDVNTLAFSSDGKSLATGSRDGTFQVWPLFPDDLIEQARALAKGRVLSVEECQIYQVDPCPESR